MNRSPPLLLSDPAETILFSRDSSETISNVIIKNASNQNVAFKVKSNASKFYKVIPNKGFLTKGQSMELKLKCLISEESAKHSFMIISQAVDVYSANFDEMWKKSDSSLVQKIKLRVATGEPKSVMSSPAEDQIKLFISQRDYLKEELKQLSEELKLCRINTLKYECNHSKEYEYTQVILVLILGLISGFFLPYLLFF